jgi:hypothetical protein
MAVAVNDPFTGTGMMPVRREDRVVVQLPPAMEVIFDWCSFRHLAAGFYGKQLSCVPGDAHSPFKRSHKIRLYVLPMQRCCTPKVNHEKSRNPSTDVKCRSMISEQHNAAHLHLPGWLVVVMIGIAVWRTFRLIAEGLLGRAGASHMMGILAANAASRPSEIRTSHVRGPREMSYPAFRAI